MATLKSLIQTLFKLSGGQAYIDNQYQSIPQQESAIWGPKYVAPSDGYVCIWGDSISSVQIRNVNLGILVRAQANASAGAILPVRKGEEFFASITYSDGTTPTYRFYRRVGSS